MRNYKGRIAAMRRRVFAAVAKIAYEGDYKRVDRLPYELTNVEGEDPTRPSIFLERAIIGERVRLALGLPLREADERSLLSDVVDRTAIADKYYDPPLINIIKYACNACPPTHYEVSAACRGCLARNCQNVCPKDAIRFSNGKAEIDQSKCIKCGACADNCPFKAISRS